MHFRETALKVLFYTLTVVFLLMMLVSSRSDFVIASGSEIMTKIYRNSLWYQVSLLFTTSICLFFVFFRGSTRKYSTFVLTIFFIAYIASLQTISLSFKRFTIEEYYGPIKVQSIELNQNDGKVLQYTQEFFFTYYRNDKGEVMSIFRWPLPNRHNVELILSDGYSMVVDET